MEFAPSAPTRRVPVAEVPSLNVAVIVVGEVVVSIVERVLLYLGEGVRRRSCG